MEDDDLDLGDKEEPFYIEYLELFKNLPMMMLMLSHLLMHLGNNEIRCFLGHNFCRNFCNVRLPY